MPLVRTTSSAADARRRGLTAFLDAAEALVAEGARYADLAVGGLAERAGFSRASFYAYFSDKRALAVAVGERFREHLEAEVGDWLRGTDDGTLADALRGTLQTFARHRGAVLLLAEASAYDAELAAFWRDLHGTFEELVRARLSQDHPEVADQDAAARAFTLAWATQAVVVEHLAAGRVDDDALVAALDRLWRAGLGLPAT